MSATGVLPRLASPVTFWRSTNGKKVVMAVTGCMMLLFVIGHMLGNLQVFEGPGTAASPARIDVYGHFLHSLGELLWIERGIMTLAILLHITATVQLALRSKAARPVGYSRKEAINSSYASRTMYWSGPIVLVFIIFHLLHFTAGVIHPQATFAEGAVYANMVSGFKVWWVSVWYVFAVGLLCFHLSHGMWAMFQSVGLAHKRHTATLKLAAKVFAVLIWLGYSSIPVSVLLGIIK